MSDTDASEAGTTPAYATSVTPPDVFANVLCAVNDSYESREVLAQAAALTSPASQLTVCGVWNAPSQVSYAWFPPLEAAALAGDPSDPKAIGGIWAGLPSDARLISRFTDANPAPELLKEASALGATLVVVGTRDHGRIAGIVLGSVVTRMLHDAPCSVLVARRTGPRRFPSRIVVGADGTPESARANEVATQIAERHGSSLEFVTARADSRESESGDRDAVAALCDTDADLIVVGSHGLRGMRALGSVSERVAHQAECSVLVVR